MSAWSIAIRPCTRVAQVYLTPEKQDVYGGIRLLLETTFACPVHNVYKPAGIHVNEATGDTKMGRSAPTSSWSFLDDSHRGRPVNAETVSRLCQQGQIKDAVEALGLLVQADCRVRGSLFHTVLKECVVRRNLVLSRIVHALTVEKGYESDTFLGNHLVRMYASHSRLQEAMDVFTVVAIPDAFMWSSIISAHVRNGQAREAIQLYHQMRRSSVKPDGHVFVAALQACAAGADLEAGQQVHADILSSGFEHSLFVSNGLVDMYAKCCCLEGARKVFNRLRLKDEVTWNAMISGYSQQGKGEEALHLYTLMQEDGIAAPTPVTFVCLLQACASVGCSALEKGKQLHAEIGERGVLVDVIVGSSLVNMYAKCGGIEDARRVFDGLRLKGVVTWNAMMGAYSQKGMGQECLRLYAAMVEGVVAPDCVTFVCLLQACASMGSSALETGRQLHAEIGEQGLQTDVVVGCSLVNMYAKCGCPQDAQGVFDRLSQKNVVTWTALIAGYAQQGMGQEALLVYSRMQDEGLAPPNPVTFLCILQACASVGAPALETGKQLHTLITEQGLEADGVVGCGLVDMYAKCGSLEDAQVVFDGLVKKDVVTWTSLIAGYSHQGRCQEALRLHSAMREERMSPPNSVTFVCLLKACANVAALHSGRHLHAELKERGLESDMFVAISLINMYAKSGSIVDAQRVFDKLPTRDVVSWNALIAGYTHQGDSDAVFELVRRMRKDGILPDAVTFLSLLTVCSHVGLVNKGRENFEAMSNQYGIAPSAKHYSCMVDLLGRAGHLDEALAMAHTMPVQPHDAVWHTLLGACRKWSNVEVGRLAFDEAVKLDENCAASYVLMASIYRVAEMWEEAREMHARRVRLGAWKQPGQSWWTDMVGLVHCFVAGDTMLPEVDKVYAKLEELVAQVKKEGIWIVPYQDSASGDISHR